MERLFIRVLQMSLAGAVVILGVLLLRLLMRRSPGRFRYLLWIVPAFRLCVPLSLTSPVSLFRLLRSACMRASGRHHRNAIPSRSCGRVPQWRCC